MGTITIRKRKDEASRYIAQIRIMQKGVTVYTESQTFDRKSTMQAWIKRCETEMAEPEAIAQARYSQGSDSYLDTLLAQRTLYAARKSLLDVRLSEASAQVRLYEALGGGAH